jgi:hypothetical protein
MSHQLLSSLTMTEQTVSGEGALPLAWFQNTQGIHGAPVASERIP